MARLFRTKHETRKSLWRRAVDLALTDVRVLAGGVDHATLETLEERLLEADFGVQATLRLVDHVEGLVRRGKVREGRDLTAALEAELRRILDEGPDRELRAADRPPTVYLIAGVNGVGKTTSVAKLAHLLKEEGRSVLVAAADTFRAGAVAQLEVWAERIGVGFVRGQHGGDPAAVAFDAVDAAVARGTEVVLVDTAGRLHTNRGLMEELRKVDRVVRRRLEGAPHESLLVLDATVGQNALNQVRAFREALDLTGIVLAKLDSTARGGVVVALQQEFGIPVKLVGTGEGVDDLRTFDTDSFLDGILADG
ncbi:MAG: signal recognition particle-docking protein FtsY [Longimicrobiales bacterium]|nr:signal recognition particle-docking protein FtsY [Longimicrobiales bacterium]